MNNTKKIDLKDVTFLIPFRLDSVSRMQNLSIILSYLTNYFNTNISILEADVTSSVQSIYKHPSISYYYQFDDKPYFHHSFYNNRLILEADSPFIAIYDCDVIVPAEQNQKAADLLRNLSVDFVLPHNGECYNIDNFTKQVLLNKFTLDSLIGWQKYYYLITKLCFGGCLFANRSKYIKIGMDNECIVGWGHEDIERIKRIQKMGMKFSSLNGPIYHLQHDRSNSEFIDTLAAIKSYEEYLQTCKLARAELTGE